MSDEEVQQPVELEKKEERTDELDVIGGLLIAFIQRFVNSLRNRNKPQ